MGDKLDKPLIIEDIFLPFVWKARFKPTGSFFCSHMVPFVLILARINLQRGNTYNYEEHGMGVVYEIEKPWL